METEETFEQTVRAALSGPLPVLPPKEQKIGASNVTWFESDPGVAVIFAFDGTPDDRTLARAVVSAQLEGHGYEPARFSIDGSDELRKEGHWNDIDTVMRKK